MHVLVTISKYVKYVDDLYSDTLSVKMSAIALAALCSLGCYSRADVL